MAAPLAGYTRPQRRVIRAIDREADTRGAGRKLRLAAYMTGLVESSLRNLRYGDGTSLGWRQETASSYPGVNRLDLRGSVRRFFNEAEGALKSDPGLKPGQLAQAVQRSAFPGRYAGQRGQALDLLAATRRVGWRGGSGGGGVSVTMPSISRGQVEPGGAGVSALLAQLQAVERPQIPSSSLPAPSFSARAVLPKGYQPSGSSGGPAPQGPRLSDLLKSVEGLSGAVPPRSTVNPGSVSGGAQNGAGGRPGGAGGLQAHADGWYGTKTLAQTGKSVAADMGIGISSEKRDRKFTDTGNISDHWVGNRKAWADDFDTPGIDSATGLRLARKVARAYGVRFVPNSYASGGTVKVGHRTYRIQILYGSAVGHGDHVHVGLMRVL